MKPAVFHGAAREELDDAITFYEGRSAGLGIDFLASVEKSIILIQRNPQRWPEYATTGLRKYLVDRFPFAIFYAEMQDCIWIAAIAHGSRRPNYWRNRRPK